MLVWKGHWFSGGVRIQETDPRGVYTIFADSLDARPLSLRGITMRFGPTPGASSNLSESPPSADSALRIGYRVLEFEQSATAAYIRLRDRHAHDRQLADSLNVLAARFADAVDSVRLGSNGFAEYRHGDPYPWIVAVNLAPLPKTDPPASTVPFRTRSLPGDFNEHLQKGRTVIVFSESVSLVVPASLSRDLHEQLSALLVGRTPRVTVISDSSTLHQLLTPEPIERAGR